MVDQRITLQFASVNYLYQWPYYPGEFPGSYHYQDAAVANLQQLIDLCSNEPILHYFL